MPGNEHNVRKRKAASTDSASSSSSPANTATAASKASAKPQKRSRQLPFCMNLTITVLVAFGSVFALVFFYPSEDDYDCRTFRLVLSHFINHLLADLLLLSVFDQAQAVI
ncbi:unnamed protein product [Anisakis simplex]|uniref:Transmembrane protein 30C n=1 Tax=Anisakis simplex TaxID=6269 RepID=A0A0M3KDW3_ANISI|nr:unnamed protein product [Anisakis simplex]